MKKIVFWVGVLFLSIVVILNILFTANLDASEHILINTNGIIYVLSLVLLGTIMFLLTEFANKYLYKEDSDSKKRLRKIIFVISITLYVIFSILWVILVRPAIIRRPRACM